MQDNHNDEKPHNFKNNAQGSCIRIPETYCLSLIDVSSIPRCDTALHLYHLCDNGALLPLPVPLPVSNFLCSCPNDFLLSVINPEYYISRSSFYQFSLLYDPVNQHSTTAIANISSQLFANTSSTSVSNFSYIIPYGQTQDCNIYGPICQTGSITVGVNLTSATTTTVLPCSSYLSAQAAQLEYENDPDNPQPGDTWANPEAGVFWLNADYTPPSNFMDWIIGFGQSPECRSYAEAISQGRYTFSDCGSSNTVIQTARAPDDSDFDYPLQIPPGVVRQFSPVTEGTCCGNCSLNIPEVRLYYFPDETINCHQNQTSNVTSTLPAQNLEKRIHSLVANGSTAVISGHTL